MGSISQRCTPIPFLSRYSWYRETNRSCYWANSQARYALLTNAVIKFVFSYRRRFFNLCLTLSNILHFPSLSFTRWLTAVSFSSGATIRALYRLKGLPIRKAKLIVFLRGSRVFRISLSSRLPFILVDVLSPVIKINRNRSQK